MHPVLQFMSVSQVLGNYVCDSVICTDIDMKLYNFDSTLAVNPRLKASSYVDDFQFCVGDITCFITFVALMQVYPSFRTERSNLKSHALSVNWKTHACGCRVSVAASAAFDTYYLCLYAFLSSDRCGSKSLFSVIRKYWNIQFTFTVTGCSWSVSTCLSRNCDN